MMSKKRLQQEMQLLKTTPILVIGQTRLVPTEDVQESKLKTKDPNRAVVCL
jgi:hypothetical protein